MRIGVLVILALALALAACGGATGGGGSDAGSDPGDSYPGADEPELAEHAEAARAQLADELGVAAEDIEIVLAERVTWNSGALGCAEEGQAYTQALVEGYRIELRHDGESYAFHGQDGQPPFHCEEPTETAPAG